MSARKYMTRHCCDTPRGQGPHEEHCTHYKPGSKAANPRFDRKQRNEMVTLELLRHREHRARNYPTAKWICFCREMLAAGYLVLLREAAVTYSKYITVANGKREYLLRFSNHKPVKRPGDVKDCDLFVGITDDTVITTEQAIQATIDYLGPSPKAAVPSATL